MSTLNVTSIKGRAGAIPNLPDGAIVSGIATIGAGGIDVTGVVTATSLESDTKISAGSSITATSFYGSGANLTGLPTQSPVVTGIASGTIPANRALSVFNDGKVGLITGTTFTWSLLQPLGTSAPNLSGNNHIQIAYGGGKVFVIARDQDGGNNLGKCIVGTPNAGNLTVTWGSWTQFETSIGNYVRVVYDSNADKFVIAYNRSSATKTRVATVSGTSITYGTEVEVIGAQPESIEGCFDPDNNKVIWVYKTGANIPYARVGTVSGTSISLGTQLTISGSGSNGPVGTCYDTKNNKVIIVVGYDASYSLNGYAYICTVTGTDISNAAAGIVNYNYQHSRLNLLYDEDRDRYVFASFNGNDSQWESLVGKYVSASSITWGEVNLIDKYTSNTGNYNSLAYDPYAKVYALLYNNSSGDLVKYSRGTINPIGSTDPETMTWTAPKQIFKGSYGSLTIANIGNSFIQAYGAPNPSAYSANYRLEGFRNSTLAYDGDNYIGYSADAYTNGQTVTIQVVGSVSTQVGLTPGLKYYIQGDGGLVSYIDPNFPTSTEAGIALDATKLLIK